MALMKKLAYCVGSKTHSIDMAEKILPDKIEYKIIVKVRFGFVNCTFYFVSHRLATRQRLARMPTSASN